MEHGIVYHYCSVDSFVSILQTYKLRLSDINKMNDTKERIWIQEKVYEKAIDNIKHDKKGVRAFKESWKMLSPIFNQSDTFIACFSENGDLLSQWRGYGQDGFGLAIGFSIDVLKINTLQYASAFQKVEYDEDVQTEYINTIVKGFIGDTNVHAILDFIQNERFNTPFYKSPVFLEEKEWRFILYNNSKGEESKDTYSSDNLEFSSVKVRSDGCKLIPYIEMDFSKVKDDLIKEIIIGPKSSIKKDDIEILLNMCDYKFNLVKITKSQIPYV